MHPFRQFIQQYVTLSEEEWDAVRACIERKEVGKNHLLLQEGGICRRLWFLERGLIRFFIWKDGTDITKYFTEAPYTFTAQQSFRLQIPAKENMETLEDCTLWEMNRGDAFRLLKWKNWSEFIRQLVQEVQGYTEEILEALQTETAENRYRMMLREQPDMLQRVPLKHLASFLGVAPQSLSRIRKQVKTRLEVNIGAVPGRSGREIFAENNFS